MSITIRESRHGVSIRATGVDGQRLLRAVCGALQPQIGEPSGKQATRRAGNAAGVVDEGTTSVRVTLKPAAAGSARR